MGLILDLIFGAGRVIYKGVVDTTEWLIAHPQVAIILLTSGLSAGIGAKLTAIEKNKEIVAMHQEHKRAQMAYDDLLKTASEISTHNSIGAANAADNGKVADAQAGGKTLSDYNTKVAAEKKAWLAKHPKVNHTTDTPNNTAPNVNITPPELQPGSCIFSESFLTSVNELVGDYAK